MSVCDAHDTVWGSRKKMSVGEGFLLAAKFVQNSPVQEKCIQKHMVIYGGSRERWINLLQKRQGTDAWLLCEECVEFLKLSYSDKKGARKAAKKWWKDKITAGYMPGQKKKKIRLLRTIFSRKKEPPDNLSKFKCEVCGKALSVFSGGFFLIPRDTDAIESTLDTARYICPCCGFVSCFGCSADMKVQKVLCKHCNTHMECG